VSRLKNGRFVLGVADLNTKQRKEGKTGTIECISTI